MKKVYSLNLDSEVIEKVKALAGKNERSLSSEINFILKERLKKKK